jgi:putative flippase GtrA
MDRLPEQFLKFSVIGGIATLIHYLILGLLVEYWGVYPAAASAIGFTVSAIINYRLNRSLTFSSLLPHSFSFPRFIIVAVSALVLNTLVLSFCYEILSMYYLVAQLIATAIVLPWTFLGNRLWSFRDHKTTDDYIWRSR